MMWLLLVLILIVFVSYKLYKWTTAEHDFFKERGVKAVAPIPFLGTTGYHMFFKKINTLDFMNALYYAFPDEDVSGFFDFGHPIYLIRNPELVKLLAVKEFDNFPDHKLAFNAENDDLLGNSLISMTGQRWKDMRSTLSPVFTGSKMRLMFQLINDSVHETVSHLVDESKAGKEIKVGVKEMFSKFSNDIIATCAFGIKVNTFKHPDNEFYECGQQFRNFGRPLFILKFFFVRLFSRLAKALDIQITDKRISRFFISTILDTMNAREKHHIVRPDMIHLLMQVRKGDLKHETGDGSKGNEDSAGFATVDESTIGKRIVTKTWSDIELVAQCFLFFLAGFDTTSTCLTCAAYELARNPDIQQKLKEEILSTEEQLNGEPLSYEVLNKMKYMDMVISEVLRLWAPGPLTDRLCSKDFSISFNGREYEFKKDKQIWIPMMSYHRDPKFFPDPEKFDPERFSDENKHNINVNAYLPFGIGPRNCIGSRFALMEVKAILYHLLRQFEIKVYEETVIPLQLGGTFAEGLLSKKDCKLEFKLVTDN